MADKEYTEEDAHKKFAADFFNETWNYIEKKDRSEEDDEKMINLAHASRLHWDYHGEPLNFQRGEWMLSLVYSLVHRGEPALYHANKCLELTEEYGEEDHGFQDFDIAFGYECMARATKVAGKEDDHERYYEKAREAGEKIQDNGDRSWFFQCLDGIQEGGIKGL